MEGLQRSVPGEAADSGTRKCLDCQKTFKSCDCKNCSKCGTVFLKYWGTNLVKGRSHCRLCAAAVCIACHMISSSALKICVRCIIKQKEEELRKQEAMSAIEKARTTRTESSSSSVRSDSFVVVSAVNRLTAEQKKEYLFEAAKAGDHYSMVTLLNDEVDVNVRDVDKNTPLFFAAEGGHLPCVALLMERNADIAAVNNKSWTPLHALAWKGSTDSHVECGELLIEMGAGIFALTDTLETAADLAARCGGKQELVQLLQAAEVDVAAHELRDRLQSSSGLNTKDPMLKLYVATVVRHITENLTPTPTWKVKGNQSSQIVKTPELMLQEEITKSLNRGLRENNSSEEVKAEATVTRLFCSTPLSNIPKADVEPIIRSDLLPAVIANPTKLEEKLNKCQAEKVDLEKRCKRLMQSIASAAEAHEREVTRLQYDIDVAREQKDIALKRCEATFVNKMAKLRQETEATVHEANERVRQAEKDRSEVLQLQKTCKLTWVPDELVCCCSNNKCRALFSQTKRRHHCRCCGRIFCQNCTLQSVPLPAFGYRQPVRVCNPCFALVDDMFCEEALPIPQFPAT